MDIKQEFELAKKIAREAGQIALLKQSSLIINHKPLGEGPVSDADILIDDFISSRLKKEFPHDQIISEESYQGEPVRIQGRVWFVDPIDGTSSYVVGRDDFVVMIGLAKDGDPILGVIYQPKTDTMWSGWRFGQARECERIRGNVSQKLLIQRETQSSENIRLIVSRTSRSKRQAQLIEAIHPLSISYQGSFGLKAMLVMEKEADFYVCWSRKIKLWDTCAPNAIIRASGALMSYLDKSPLSFNESINHDRSVMVASFEPDAAFMTLLKKLDDS